MENNLQKKYFKSKFNRIITSGQDRVSYKSFIKKPETLIFQGLRQVLVPMALSAIFVFLVYLFFVHSKERTVDSLWSISFELFKILIGGLIVFLVTSFLTNKWQCRAYSFEMIKELNSTEFLNIRNNLSNRMRRSIAHGNDIDNLEEWFPFNDSYLKK